MSCCWVPFVIGNCTVLPRTFLCMLFFFQQLSLMVLPFVFLSFLGVSFVLSWLPLVQRLSAVAGNAAWLFHKVSPYRLQFRVKFWLCRNVFDTCRRVKGSLQRTFAMKMPVVAFQRFAKCCDKIFWQQASRGFSSNILPPTEIEKITAAFTSKALETIALGNLPPGKELELISALDLGTVTWDQLPVRLKDKLKLPRGDRGIDSMSLGSETSRSSEGLCEWNCGFKRPCYVSLPGKSGTLHLEGRGSRDGWLHLAKAQNYPNCGIILAGPTHRAYSPDEMETWRKKAQEGLFGKNWSRNFQQKRLYRVGLIRKIAWNSVASFFRTNQRWPSVTFLCR